MQNVTDLLARKYPQFNATTPTSLVSDALYKMCCENVDYLIVTENDRFKGIITDHDIASKILFENRPLNKIEVGEFMNTSLPTVTPDTSIASCLQTMERFNARHVAIFDRFEFKGVVSSHDLMQEAVSKQADLFAEAEPRRGYPWTY